MKRKMTLEELLEKDHYKSIINLTLHYQLKAQEENKKFEGLRAIHYRWALCPNHDGLDGSLFKGTLHKYFGSDLKELYKSKKVVKNSVTDRKNLSNFLRHLSKKGLLNKKIKENNTPYYTISMLLQGYINKEASINALKSYRTVSVQHFPDALNNQMMTATWFGCPELLSKYVPRYGKFEYDPEDEEFIAENLAKMFTAAMNIFSRFNDMVDGGMHPMNFVIDVGPPFNTPVIRKNFKCVFEDNK
jgi:hypothetical protein